jgi:hypothetical protein
LSLSNFHLSITTLLSDIESCAAPRLCLGRGLVLLILLQLLLLLFVLLIQLALVRSFFSISLGDGLEETLQACLLRALQVLLEPSSCAANAILGESLFGDKECDQSFHVGLFPLEIAKGVVCLAHIGVEE